jgi:hypothetical protein
MRRRAPEYTRWIPAFAGMTGIFGRMMEICWRSIQKRATCGDTEARGKRGDRPEGRETACGAGRGDAAQNLLRRLSPRIFHGSALPRRAVRS